MTAAEDAMDYALDEATGQAEDCRHSDVNVLAALERNGYTIVPLDHARLARIGAAVEPMLAALRHYRDDHDDRRDATCRCGWCDIARAAIAAATGCTDHDPNHGPGSDWCPNCRLFAAATGEGDRG